MEMRRRLRVKMVGNSQLMMIENTKSKKKPFFYINLKFGLYDV